ncbi:MAG: hypothetical protein WAT46_15030, partial [Saprospiraceae bacterium]
HEAAVELQSATATLYVETEGIGHTYIELEGTVYTYGRYGTRTPESSGSLAPVGEGILYKYTGKAAKGFISDHLSKYETEIYKIKLSNSNATHKYFNSLIAAGSKVAPFKYNVDSYNLIGNNCTTHSLNALRVGGANLPFINSPQGVSSYFKPSINQEIIYSKWGPKY